MNLTIDFRDHDSREQGLTLTQRVTEVTIDLQLAQRIRDGLRKQGLRVPLTEAEQFAEADARMRSRA
jgi:N-acetylmuramoyl-L-alanine amidase